MVEVLTVGCRRPKKLPLHCAHIPAVTTGFGARMLSAGAVARGHGATPARSWGWWRDVDGHNLSLAARWSGRLIVDLEPDEWQSRRPLTSAEVDALATCPAITSWGYPRPVARCLAAAAEAGLVGYAQLYRDGADEAKARTFIARRLDHWRRMGFTTVVGVLGGARSGRRWNQAGLKVLKEQGCGVAYVGFDGEIAASSATAFSLGLGRATP